MDATLRGKQGSTHLDESKLIADFQIRVQLGWQQSSAAAAAVSGAGGWLQTAELTDSADSCQPRPLRCPAQIQKEQVGIAALDWGAPSSLCLQMVGSLIGSENNSFPEPVETKQIVHFEKAQKNQSMVWMKLHSDAIGWQQNLGPDCCQGPQLLNGYMCWGQMGKAGTETEPEPEN